MDVVKVGPHAWSRMGRRFWLCRYCLAPRKSHPRLGWTESRAYGDVGRRRFREDSDG